MRFLLVAALAYSGGMGMGDVKLGAVMGLYLGRAVAPALLVAFAVGAVVGVGLMLRHGAAARKQAVPFGPFLAIGGVVGLLAGDEILDWYLGHLLSRIGARPEAGSSFRGDGPMVCLSATRARTSHVLQQQAEISRWPRRGGRQHRRQRGDA